MLLIYNANHNSDRTRKNETVASIFEDSLFHAYIICCFHEALSSYTLSFYMQYYAKIKLLCFYQIQKRVLLSFDMNNKNVFKLQS